jgi:hypothetical protein
MKKRSWIRGMFTTGIIRTGRKEPLGVRSFCAP